MNSEILPTVGDYYRHYKGNLYKIIATGFDSETTDPVVIYQGQYDDSQFGVKPIWVRPLAEWTQNVEFDGQTITRFTKVKSS